MIRELRTLQAVARAGTFAAAGAQVGLTQAAVSAQMQRLEARLGFALFDRDARAARLNARGQQALRQAEEVLALYDALGTPAERAAQAVPLVVGAVASVQRAGLARALVRLQRVLPGVSLDLLDQVDAGEVDMAVIVRPPFGLARELRWTPLAREPFRLLVPRTRAGVLGEGSRKRSAGGMGGDDWRRLLAEAPFVRYDRASFGGRLVERFLHAHRIEVQQVAEVDELDAITVLVGHGMGVALVPETAGAAAWPRAVRALDLGEATFHREIGLLRRRAVAAANGASGAAAARLAALLLDGYAERPSG